MIKKIKKEFGKDVEHMRPSGTPMGPGIAVQRPTEADRKSVVQGKSVDLGGRRIIKKKKNNKKIKKKKQ